MERRGDSGVTTFFVDATPMVGSRVALSDAAVKHAHVRRLGVSDPVRLTDGCGTVVHGILKKLDYRTGEVEVMGGAMVDAPVSLTVLVPVADRDRMLWLAEKAAELAVTDWRPVVYARSRSVSPRGEGAGFARRVRARMIGALEQSGGAWLPAIHGEQPLDEAITACGDARGFVLAADGTPLPSLAPFPRTALAVGPEGGLESAELEHLLFRGWRSASLGGTTLRFETAGVAAIAIIRATEVR